LEGLLMMEVPQRQHNLQTKSRSWLSRIEVQVITGGSF